jgi:hypothetical protein
VAIAITAWAVFGQWRVAKRQQDLAERQETGRREASVFQFLRAGSDLVEELRKSDRAIRPQTGGAPTVYKPVLKANPDTHPRQLFRAIHANFPGLPSSALMHLHRVGQAVDMYFDAVAAWDAERRDSTQPPAPGRVSHLLQVRENVGRSLDAVYDDLTAHGLLEGSLPENRFIVQCAHPSRRPDLITAARGG